MQPIAERENGEHGNSGQNKRAVRTAEMPYLNYVVGGDGLEPPTLSV